jgi:hypothetical protein
MQIKCTKVNRFGKVVSQAKVFVNGKPQIAVEGIATFPVLSKIAVDELRKGKKAGEVIRFVDSYSVRFFKER